MTSSGTRERLADALRPAVERSGLELEDVEVTPVGRKRVVRLIVDRDGGVTDDHLAETAREVSRQLDADDDELLGRGSYTLEVTSPGTDRPLTQPKHWRRNIGRLVKITREEGGPVTGRIIEARDTAASVDVDGSVREIAYADVTKARVQVEFKRAGG